MSANAWGRRFVVTTFGESHGEALGAVIDGCPAGVPLDLDLLESELARRRPGTREASGALVVSARGEEDRPEVLSGVHDRKTLGTPIAVVVRNRDARPQDYAALENDPAAGNRRGHADDLWRRKYGHSDVRGGGRASGRETVARVIGGAVARMFLRELSPSLRVKGFSRRIGPLALDDDDLKRIADISPGAAGIDTFPARFPSVAKSGEVEALLVRARSDGRSWGGVAEVWIENAPPLLGAPVFHKLKADLAHAVMGIGATSGFEIGAGFEAARAEGSEFHAPDGDPARYGGIRGGISTGETIVFRVSFKPTSSVLDTARKGRHDPCVVPRAVPVLEAMAWLVLADHRIAAAADRLDRFSPEG